MTNKNINVFFYKTEMGNQPVREELLKLDKEDRYKVGADIKAVELGWPIGLPVCRPVGKLWEVRTNLKNTIYRVLFGIDGNIMVLLHSFVKKTQKTSKNEIDTALERWKIYKKS